jgi:hypothetical protein
MCAEQHLGSGSARYRISGRIKWDGNVAKAVRQAGSG